MMMVVLTEKGRSFSVLVCLGDQGVWWLGSPGAPCAWMSAHGV